MFVAQARVLKFRSLDLRRKLRSVRLLLFTIRCSSLVKGVHSAIGLRLALFWFLLSKRRRRRRLFRVRSGVCFLFLLSGGCGVSGPFGSGVFTFFLFL